MDGHSVPPMSWDWQVVEPGEIAAHAAAWDSLVVHRRYPAFMRARFLEGAVGTFGCPRGKLVLGRAADRLALGALVVPSGWGRWVTYQPSQLPLGAWVMAAGCRWEDVLPEVARALPGYVVSLSVTQQDPLFAERPDVNPRFEVLDYVPTGWIDVDGSYEDFWQSRGKNLRQNLRKQRRRLEEQGHRLEFNILESPEAVDAAFVDFARLESAGWKAAQGTAIAVDNAQGAFYRGVLADAAARGGAFAFRLALDGRPIAVDFGLRDPASVVILKTTYDETLKSSSPAQLLHEQAFELIFEQRLAPTIEFYGKVMEWHTRWTDQARVLYHVNYFRMPLLQRLRNVLRNRRARRDRADASQNTE